MAVGDRVLVTSPAFFKLPRYGIIRDIKKGLNHTLYGVGNEHGWVYFTEEEVQPYRLVRIYDHSITGQA